MYRFILFYFVLYICIYVAPWSCEARHLVPLYVHTCSGMTIKLNLTWLWLKLISVTSSLGLKRWRGKLILYNKLYSFYHYHGFNCRVAVAVAAIFAGATVRGRHLSRCTGSRASLSRLPLCIYYLQSALHPERCHCVENMTSYLSAALGRE